LALYVDQIFNQFCVVTVSKDKKVGYDNKTQMYTVHQSSNSTLYILSNSPYCLLSGSCCYLLSLSGLLWCDCCACQTHSSLHTTLTHLEHGESRSNTELGPLTLRLRAKYSYPLISDFTSLLMRFRIEGFSEWSAFGNK